MNKVYKSVWNESIGAWVAVSETATARGKRNARLTKTLLASAVTLVAVGGASAEVSLDGGKVAPAPSGNGIAIGSGSVATADYGVATGAGASATGVGDAAIGADAKVASGAPTGDGGTLGSVAVGSNAHALATSAAAFGARADASGLQSTALGSHASASATASTAIGMNALADRANTATIGNATTQRQLVQVARGTQTNDAVNVGQLTPLVSALGGTAAFKADGSITAPTYKVKGTTFNNVGDAITALDSNKYLSANDAADSTEGATAIGLEALQSAGTPWQTAPADRPRQWQSDPIRGRARKRRHWARAPLHRRQIAYRSARFPLQTESELCRSAMRRTSVKLSTSPQARRPTTPST